MNSEQELQAMYRREHRIDETLKETFPASDPPSFVGAGAPKASNNKTTVTKPELERVNIDKPDELDGWCAYWGCTTTELKNAVLDVGANVAMVEAQLTVKRHTWT